MPKEKADGVDAGTTNVPMLATAQQLVGSYAVIMVDLDIPTGMAQTNTLLHWMQTGLTSAATATQMNTPTGLMQGFVLENTGRANAAAAYFGPNPPPVEPLTHRYTLLLVDHTAITQPGLNALVQAAQTRQGFNAAATLAQAGLTDKVVAGNFFTVTSGDTRAGNGTRTPTPTPVPAVPAPTGSGVAVPVRPVDPSTPISRASVTGPRMGVAAGAVVVSTLLMVW